MVAEAGDWRWSSARSHLTGRRTREDPLTDVHALGEHMPRWRNYLKLGAEAAGDKAGAEAIEARLRTGRPMAGAEWIAEMEQTLQRPLAPQKRGPKPKKPAGN